jgi:hypothetical protein
MKMVGVSFMDMPTIYFHRESTTFKYLKSYYFEKSVI